MTSTVTQTNRPRRAASSSVADRRRAILERRDGGAPSARTAKSSRPADRRRSAGGRAHGRVQRSTDDTIGVRIRRALVQPVGRDRSAHQVHGLAGLFGVDAASRAARQARVRLDPPPGTYYVIAAVVAVFVMLGLVMVLSASAVTQATIGNSPYAVFNRQLLWAGLGFVGLVAAARIPYTVWMRLSPLLVLVGLVSMAGPFMPGIGSTVNGARSWINIAGQSVQPSEFLKLVVVVGAADLLTRRQRELADHRRVLFPVALLAVVAAGASLAQGDLGSAVVLGGIVLAVAWVAGVPAFPLGMLGAGAASLAVLFVVSSERRLSRFTAFLDIEGNKEFGSYQVYQGMVSMANGGLGGSGIGGSRAKLGYLPYAHSDFIFAIVVDELGLMGTIAVVGGFIVLVAFGVQTALAAPDRFGMLLAGGISAWFGLQAIINLGGVTGVMPVTGLTLPFFSAGGSSLFVSMIAAGLLLSVARRAVRT